MSITIAISRDDATEPAVHFTDVESTALAAAAATRTHGAARIIGLPDSAALALGERLGELLAERVSPWATPLGPSHSVSATGVGCQDLTAPAETATPGASPWSTPLSGG